MNQVQMCPELIIQFQNNHDGSKSILRLLHSQGAWKPRRKRGPSPAKPCSEKKDDANDRSSKLGTEGNPPGKLPSDPQRAAGVSGAPIKVYMVNVNRY